MLQFSQFVWALSYSVWDVFNNFLLIDATDRSKISGDQKRFFIALSLYPLSFLRTLPLSRPADILIVLISCGGHGLQAAGLIFIEGSSFDSQILKFPH